MGSGRERGVTEGDERDAEIARLRQKLAFYESFDRVIAENISRSGELLRQAVEQRDSASSQAAELQREAERQRTTELEQERALLSALLDDVIQLQGQAERLARRVGDALDDVESERPAGGGGEAARRRGERGGGGE
jgi:small-conductance mechanosensitive channel